MSATISWAERVNVGEDQHTPHTTPHTGDTPRRSARRGESRESDAVLRQVRNRGAGDRREENFACPASARAQGGDFADLKGPVGGLLFFAREKRRDLGYRIDWAFTDRLLGAIQ